MEWSQPLTSAYMGLCINKIQFVNSWNFMIRSFQNPKMGDLWKLALYEWSKERWQNQSRQAFVDHHAPEPHQKIKDWQKVLEEEVRLLAPVALLAMLAVTSQGAIPANACYCTTASFVTWFHGSDDYHLLSRGFARPFYCHFRFQE